MALLNDPFDIEEIWAERADMAARTLQTVPAGEARALIMDVFKDQTSHPWFEKALGFIEENGRESLVRGSVPGGVTFLYHPKAGRGMWFKADTKLEAVGVIGPRGLKVLADLAAAKQLNP